MCSKLSFYFNSKDPEFIVNTQNISTKPNNLIQQVFIRTPIYNKCGKKIGYKTSNDLLQQVSSTEYAVRIYNTYFIEGEGTINWEYSFINDKPSVLYPVGIMAESNIVSGTGDFLNLKGNVTLYPTPDGLRQVKIFFK